MRSEDEEDEEDYEEENDNENEDDENDMNGRSNGYGQDENMEYYEEEGSGDENEEEDASGDDDEDEDEEQDMDGDGDADEDEDEDDEDEEDRSDDEDVDMNGDEGSSHTSQASPKSPGARSRSKSLEPVQPPHLTRRSLFTPAFPSIPPGSSLSINIEAIVAIPLPCPVYSLATTTCCSYLLTGGADGHIRAYDFWASVNGKAMMTAQQRSIVGLGEGVNKAGMARGWWRNEVEGPAGGPVGKRMEGVYSMAVEGDGLWALTGTQSGPINLYTLRHSPGHLVHSLKGHSSVVSALALLPHEKGFMSGSWDGSVREWDLNTGQVVRQYPTHGAQISGIALRPYTPLSPTPSPVADEEENGMDVDGEDGEGGDKLDVSVRVGDDFGKSQGDETGPPKPDEVDGDDEANKDGAADNTAANEVIKAPSPAPSSHNSLFDDDDADGETVLPSGQITGTTTPLITDNINDMAPPPLSPKPKSPKPSSGPGLALPGAKPKTEPSSNLPSAGTSIPSTPLFNLPQPVASSSRTAAAGIPLLSPTSFKGFSDDVFLTSSMDGQVVVMDKRVKEYETEDGVMNGVGRLMPGEKAPPWCMSACWSGSGNQVLAGRRNGTIDIWDIRHSLRQTTSSSGFIPVRSLRTPQESGAVSSVIGLPDGKHFATASQDNIRLWNLDNCMSEEVNAVRKKGGRPPFKIIAGHHGGTISSLVVDPTCRFLISASGDRGWQGEATKVVLIHEIKW